MSNCPGSGRRCAEDILEKVKDERPFPVKFCREKQYYNWQLFSHISKIIHEGELLEFRDDEKVLLIYDIWPDILKKILTKSKLIIESIYLQFRKEVKIKIYVRNWTRINIK